MDMAGIMCLGGTPAIIHPSASALTKWPTSSGESKPATTPVERTTKCRSSLISRLAVLSDFCRVSRTSSATDSLVSEMPVSVLPKISSSGLGLLTSRVIFTVLLTRLVLPSSRLVAVSMHLVVVLPTSTEATIK